MSMTFTENNKEAEGLECVPKIIGQTSAKAGKI